MLPVDKNDFFKSVISTLGFVSNFFFWFETGYWGTDNEVKPLLHTWSLSVEEQFYIFFPLMVFFVLVLIKKKIASFISVLLLLSFVYTFFIYETNPTLAFFSPLTRAWELLAGSMAALFIKDDVFSYFKGKKYWLEGFSFLGLSLIIGSFVFFDSSINHPGISTIIPVLGTVVLILFLNIHTFIGYLLSNKYMVAIGLMSYGMYLWHQPVFAFYRYGFFGDFKDLYYFILIILSIIGSYFSLRIVERPFRNSNLINDRVFVSIIIISITSIVFYASIYLYKHDEYLHQEQHALADRSIQDRLSVNYGLNPICDGVIGSPLCRTSAQPDTLVWGDSFAMHIVDAVLTAKPNLELIQMTKSACGPVFDIAPVNSQKFPVEWAKGCLVYLDQVKTEISNIPSLKYAILSSPFGQYMRQGNEVLDKSGNVFKADQVILEKYFMETLKFLEDRNITPIIVSPPPANGKDIGRCLARAHLHKLNMSMCDIRSDDFTDERILAYEFLQNIPKEYKVIRLDNVLCDSDVCKSHFGDVWLYRDKGHLSIEGSKYIGRTMNIFE